MRLTSYVFYVPGPPMKLGNQDEEDRGAGLNELTV